LTEREAAKLLGVSERHFRRIASRYESVESEEPATNGRYHRLYRIGSFPDDAQQRWAMQHGWQVAAGDQGAPRTLLSETEAAGLLSPGAGSGLLLAPVDLPGVEHGFRARGEVPGKTVDALPHPAWRDASDGKPTTQIALNLAAPSLPAISAEDRAMADARYKIIEPLIAPERHRALWAQFHGRVELIEFLARQHGSKVRTIYNWVNRWKGEGLSGLINKDRRDKGACRVLTAEARNWIIAAALPRPPDRAAPEDDGTGRLSVRDIYRLYGEEREWRAYRLAQGDDSHTPLPVASYETFRAWHARIPDVIRDVATRGREHYFNVHAVTSLRDPAKSRPLEIVVMDHRLLDGFYRVLDPRARDPRERWRLVRPWLTAAIDWRTRRWLGWVICESPSSDSIAAVIKRVVMDYGVPEWMYWDNGKDFRCEYLEGPERRRGEPYRVPELNTACRGVLNYLGVRVEHALPRRPHSKIIEPNFLATALFDKSLPWWCGNKPEARPERLGELMIEHQAWLDGRAAGPAFRPIEWAAEAYNALLADINSRPHSGVGMAMDTPAGHGQMSPNECWERAAAGLTFRAVPPEQIQFLFHRRREITVRQGTVTTTHAGAQFFYRLRGNSQTLMLFNGRKVELAYDPIDMGEAVIYAQGKLLGLADCVELAGMGEESFVAEERDRRASLKQIKHFIATAHAAVHIPGVTEQIHRREQVRGARCEGRGAEGPAQIIAAEMPEAIREAARAQAADSAFSFNAPPECGQAGAGLEAAAPERADGDDEFSFFER